MSKLNDIFLLFAQKEKVEKKDIPNMIRQAGIVINKNDVRRILNEYDEHITNESFLEIIEHAKSYGVDVSFVRKAFQRYDPSKSGYINACTLKNLMKDRKDEFYDAEIEETIKILTPDSEGRVNYELFIKKLMSE